MRTAATSAARRYRAVWISDVHLGFRGCAADYLLEFLHTTRCEYLYLVGDIIDIWQMRRRPCWPQAHTNVVRRILGMAKHGTQVIYIPGNHDELLRDYADTVFGNIRIQNQVIHELRDGKRLLVLHGDRFDSVVRHSPLVALIGSQLYEWLLSANYSVNVIRRHLGFPYWSLAAFLKHRVKNAVQYISNFEAAVAHEAARHAVDGVICGHIHRAELTRRSELLYCNCGDWVESCTALVETPEGDLKLVKWLEERASVPMLRRVA